MPSSVLMVDDNAAGRKVMRMMLDKLPEPVGEVFEAADGQQALQVAAVHRPSLAIIDLMLPDITGYELGAQLKAQAPETKVMVFTARMDTESLERAYREGRADKVLSRPIEPEIFLAAVADLLTSSNN